MCPLKTYRNIVRAPSDDTEMYSSSGEHLYFTNHTSSIAEILKRYPFKAHVSTECIHRPTFRQCFAKSCWFAEACFHSRALLPCSISYVMIRDLLASKLVALGILCYPFQHVPLSVMIVKFKTSQAQGSRNEGYTERVCYFVCFCRSLWLLAF